MFLWAIYATHYHASVVRGFYGAKIGVAHWGCGAGSDRGVMYILAQKGVLFRALAPVDATASWAWLTDIFELVDSGRRQVRGIFFVFSLFRLGLAAVAKWADGGCLGL